MILRALSLVSKSAMKALVQYSQICCYFSNYNLKGPVLSTKSATKALVPVFQNYREIFLYCCVWTIVYFLTKTQSEGEAGPLHDQSTGQ